MERENSLRELKENYIEDMNKYIKYSYEYVENKTRRAHESDLIFYYHKIEKGLSMPNARVGFGKENVEHLLDLLEAYVKKYDWDKISLIALDVLYEYYHFNERNNLQLDNLHTRLKELEATLQGSDRLYLGGIERVTKLEIDEKRNKSFKDLAYSRYSIRNFAPGDVSLDLIKEAIYIAQKTPSVCNRQTSKVYVYDDPKMKESVLKYQSGHVGFGEYASKILLVTTELKDFRGVIERNQGFIDGGMYAMSLIYALHSLGVGTCALNLSITNETERKLKKAGNIGESELLIMMIAVGNIPDEIKVARSTRRNVSEVMTVF